MPYDLFISYSRRDNGQGRITQLVERIKADFASFEGNNGRELVPFFDQQEIHGMEDWRQKIHQGLRESRLFLACLSPSYLKSDYCEWEFVEYLKYEIGHLHGSNGVAPIYFVEVPGWDSKDFDQQCAAWVAELRRRQNFDLRPWYDRGEEALREAAVQERMQKLNRRIAETITRGERAEKSLGNVDAHNPHFIGRLANLRMLRDNFSRRETIGVVTAVNGVGGLGKTALAIEYAHSFAHEYGGGRWQVRCAGKEDLRLVLAELATPLGFEFTDDEKKNADLQFDRTRRELKKLADAREPHRCLLILDNVDRPGLLDPAQVARLNGGDWLHVLATTRLGENELHGSHRDRSFLAIDELPTDDAFALIESYQPNGRFHSEAERDAAREIVRLLGSFTLAVESAAVYLGQFANDVTCAAFLTRIKKEGLEGLDAAASKSSEGVLHGEKRLGATLQPTLERLSATEKLALEFAALLPPDQVPLPWLRALVAKTFPELEHDAEPGYPDPWKNVVRRLFSLRLFQGTDFVDDDGQPRVVRVHRLVQAQIQLRTTQVERTLQQENLKVLVLRRFTALTKDIFREPIRWELEPFGALAILWADTGRPHATWLLNQVGLCRRELAEWPQAEPLLRRALAIDEQTLGSEHPAVAQHLNDLGRLLKVTNRLAEAEQMYRLALNINERSFGPYSHEVESCLTNLGQLLHATNRLTEAEPLMLRALTIAEQSFGPEHYSVATCLNNLAALLYSTGRFGEAEPFLRRTLVITERSHGSKHPEVALSLNNLARLLCATGRELEAEQLLRRALTIFEQSVGPKHFRIATCLNNLGELLIATKRLGEAEAFLRRALAIDEQGFGLEHPSVARDLVNLAELLRTTNRLGEAEMVLRRALAIDEKCFGAEHPAVARDLNGLAQLLKATGRTADAEPVLQRLKEITQRLTATTEYKQLNSKVFVANL